MLRQACPNYLRSKAPSGRTQTVRGVLGYPRVQKSKAAPSIISRFADQALIEGSCVRDHRIIRLCG